MTKHTDIQTGTLATSHSKSGRPCFTAQLLKDQTETQRAENFRNGFRQQTHHSGLFLFCCDHAVTPENFLHVDFSPVPGSSQHPRHEVRLPGAPEGSRAAAKGTEVTDETFAVSRGNSPLTVVKTCMCLKLQNDPLRPFQTKEYRCNNIKRRVATGNTTAEQHLKPTLYPLGRAVPAAAVKTRLSFKNMYQPILPVLPSKVHR